MNNVNKELPKALTIEDLKERIGKPVFVVGLIYGSKNWRILKPIGVSELDIIAFTDNSEIPAENQDKFRFFDEEVTFQELKEILESEEKLKKKTGYETVGKGEDYFFIASNMRSGTEYSYQWDDSIDAAREASGNHFNDKTLTINLARAERLRYQLRRFAALNGGISSVEDWAYDGNWKYFIAYDYNEQKIYVNSISKFKDFGQIYFKSEEACKKAIEIYKDELLWYFTEFQEQLY